MQQLALLIILAAALPAQASGPSTAQASGPNIVLMFVDNLGYGDFGCYGKPDDQDTQHRCAGQAGG